MRGAIKPCPFCGSKEVKLLNPSGSRIYEMLCMGCFCRTDEFDTKEDAFKAWNCRPSLWHTGKPTEKGKYYCNIDSEHAPYLILNWNGLEWLVDGTIQAVRTESVKKWQRIEP